MNLVVGMVFMSERSPHTPVQSHERREPLGDESLRVPGHSILFRRTENEVPGVYLNVRPQRGEGAELFQQLSCGAARHVARDEFGAPFAPAAGARKPLCVVTHSFNKIRLAVLARPPSFRFALFLDVPPHFQRIIRLGNSCGVVPGRQL
jgi:hypothetical protein